jgi:glycolate oxidase FAD binding subunit
LAARHNKQEEIRSLIANASRLLNQLLNAIVIQPSSISTAALEEIAEPSGVVEWQNIDDAFKQQILRSLQSTRSSNTPSHVIYPATAEQLSGVIAFAHKHNHRILLCGAGSKLAWGNPAENVQLVVSTQRLNRPIEHAQGDLTVTVEAGMRFADLQTILAKSGQFLAIDPAYPDTATIGGIVATGNTGSLRHRYNSVRDMCIGISFVRSDGELVKAGGRVVKNVAGYDLMKLLTGSYGTLGAIVQVTFRVYPLAASSATAILTGNATAISQARSEILMSTLTPTRLDLLSGSVISSLGIDSDRDLELGLVARFDSIAKSTAQQSDRLAEIAKALDLKVTNIEDSDRFWTQLQDCLWQGGDADKTIICKLGVLPTEACYVLETISTMATNLAPDLAIYMQIHASSGLGVLRCDLPMQVSSKSAIALIREVRNLAEKTGGFLSLLEAPSEIEQKLDVWGYTGNALSIMQALKQKFDPQNILNPDRLFRLSHPGAFRSCH